MEIPKCRGKTPQKKDELAEHLKRQNSWPKKYSWGEGDLFFTWFLLGSLVVNVVPLRPGFFPEISMAVLGETPPLTNLGFKQKLWALKMKRWRWDRWIFMSWSLDIVDFWREVPLAPGERWIFLTIFIHIYTSTLCIYVNIYHLVQL